MTQSVDQIIGARLRARREALNLQRVEIAAAIGKDQTILARYEYGTVQMNVATFLRACAALGVKPAAILAGLSGDRVTKLKRRAA